MRRYRIIKREYDAGGNLNSTNKRTILYAYIMNGMKLIIFKFSYPKDVNWREGGPTPYGGRYFKAEEYIRYHILKDENEKLLKIVEEENQIDITILN